MGGKLGSKIVEVDDVVDASFLHADTASAIGLTPPGRFHGVIRAEAMEFAAGIVRRLRTGLAARVHGAAGKSVSVNLGHDFPTSL